MPPGQRQVLDTAHEGRNLAEYEGEIDAGDALVAALARIVPELAAPAQS